MGAPIRFLFDNDFAAPPPEIVPDIEDETEEDVPKIELEVHLEELRKIEAAAYERGLADGQTTAEAIAQEQLASKSERLAESADKMITMIDVDLKRIEADSTALCATIAKKIAGYALEQFPETQVLGLVEECLAPLRDVRHLAVRVNEQDVDKLKEPIETLAAKNGFEGRLLILGEPETLPGDCRIEWADGGVLFERDAIVGSVDGLILDFLGPENTNYETGIEPVIDDRAEQNAESQAEHEPASGDALDDMAAMVAAAAEETVLQEGVSSEPSPSDNGQSESGQSDSDPSDVGPSGIDSDAPGADEYPGQDFDGSQDFRGVDAQSAEDPLTGPVDGDEPEDPQAAGTSLDDRVNGTDEPMETMGSGDEAPDEFETGLTDGIEGGNGDLERMETDPDSPMPEDMKHE